MAGVESIFHVFLSSRAPAPAETEDEPAPVRERRSLDDKFRDFFLKLAGDDEVIDAYELQDILTKAFKAGEYCNTNSGSNRCTCVLHSISQFTFV